MSGCLDRVSCDCECSDPFKEWIKSKRNMFASIVSGTLVSFRYFTNHFTIIFSSQWGGGLSLMLVLNTPSRYMQLTSPVVSSQQLLF